MGNPPRSADAFAGWSESQEDSGVLTRPIDVPQQPHSESKHHGKRDCLHFLNLEVAPAVAQPRVHAVAEAPVQPDTPVATRFIFRCGEWNRAEPDDPSSRREHWERKRGNPGAGGWPDHRHRYLALHVEPRP